MKTYELYWRKYPLNYNDARIAKVQANSPEDAKALLKDAIKSSGVDGFDIESCKEYKPPQVAGKVLNI